jgi:hypothetical protein
VGDANIISIPVRLGKTGPNYDDKRDASSNKSNFMMTREMLAVTSLIE